VNDLSNSLNAAPVQHLGAAEDEQVNWLFARFDATHAVLLSRAPLRVVMMNNPDIASLDSTGAGLHAVQRMAHVLMSKGQT
ncbi:MAG: hypothetical protein AB3N11_00700, partial [Arenibacterium sp.]